MLTDSAKKVLDYIIASYSPDHSSVDNLDKVFPPDISSELPEILSYLRAEGYIEYKKDITGNYRIKITHEGLHYSEFEKLSMKSPATSVTINGDVTGSAIGNIGDTTINNGASFDEIRSIIESKNMSPLDREEALRVVDCVELLTENEAPLKRGFLHKFNDVLSKHSWLPSLIGSALIRYFIG